MLTRADRHHRWGSARLCPAEAQPQHRAFQLQFTFCAQDMLYSWKTSDVASMGKFRAIGLCECQSAVHSLKTTMLSSEQHTAFIYCSSVLRVAQPKAGVTQSRQLFYSTLPSDACNFSSGKKKISIFLATPLEVSLCSSQEKLNKEMSIAIFTGMGLRASVIV